MLKCVSVLLLPTCDLHQKHPRSVYVDVFLYTFPRLSYLSICLAHQRHLNLTFISIYCLLLLHIVLLLLLPSFFLFSLWYFYEWRRRTHTHTLKLSGRPLALGELFHSISILIISFLGLVWAPALEHSCSYICICKFVHSNLHFYLHMYMCFCLC